MLLSVASLVTGLRTTAQTVDGLMKPGELETLPARAPDARLAYGTEPSQIGELRVPPGRGPHPLVILVHGGCWRAAFASMKDLPAMADALKDAGIASWNIEYRRLGETGSGWPGTYLDVGHAIDFVRTMAAERPLDVSRVVVVGHSAGGHLAMWAAIRSKIPATSALFIENPLPVRGVVNLAGTIDMTQNIDHMERACYAPVVTEMLGGTPDAVRPRYLEVSANARLPLGVRQLLVWGEHEEFVPCALAESYVAAATAAGDSARLITVPGVGHFELANPRSSAWPPVLEAIRSLFRD
jgi:acetyl esterase/lipase